MQTAVQNAGLVANLLSVASIALVNARSLILSPGNSLCFPPLVVVLVCECVMRWFDISVNKSAKKCVSIGYWSGNPLARIELARWELARLSISRRVASRFVDVNDLAYGLRWDIKGRQAGDTMRGDSRGDTMI